MRHLSKFALVFNVITIIKTKSELTLSSSDKQMSDVFYRSPGDCLANNPYNILDTVRRTEINECDSKLYANLLQILEKTQWSFPI